MKRDDKPVQDGREKDHPSDEDAFARAMADVVPLGPDPRDTVRVAPPGRTPNPPSRSSDSDEDVLARAMSDVVPLDPDPRGRVRPLPTAAAALPCPAVVEENDDADVTAAFVRPGIDRRELRKMKRGAYPVDDTRDLHGFTATEACIEVARFVERSRQQRHRCVCIVHGRGLHSKDHVAVLRTRVREALRSNPAVLGFTDAPSSDGGSGAVYVLLRR